MRITDISDVRLAELLSEASRDLDLPNVAAVELTPFTQRSKVEDYEAQLFGVLVFEPLRTGMVRVCIWPEAESENDMEALVVRHLRVALMDLNEVAIGPHLAPASAPLIPHYHTPNCEHFESDLERARR